MVSKLLITTQFRRNTGGNGIPRGEKQVRTKRKRLQKPLRDGLKNHPPHHLSRLPSQKN